MKTSRLLLATLSVVFLAACGADVTAPTPAAPARQIDLGTNVSTTSSSDSLVPPDCNGTLVTTVDPAGNTTITCVMEGKGGQHGSGH